MERQLARLLFAFFLSLALLAIAAAALAEGPVINKNTGPATLDATCKLPTTRTDGSPLLISELLYVDWYLSTNLSLPDPEPLLSNLDCRAAFDIAGLANGQYYLYARATDTSTLQSARSVTLPFVLATLAPPKAPAGITLSRGGVAVAP